MAIAKPHGDETKGSANFLKRKIFPVVVLLLLSAATARADALLDGPSLKGLGMQQQIELIREAAYAKAVDNHAFVVNPKWLKHPKGSNKSSLAIVWNKPAEKVFRSVQALKKEGIGILELRADADPEFRQSLSGKFPFDETLIFILLGVSVQ